MLCHLIDSVIYLTHGPLSPPPCRKPLAGNVCPLASEAPFDACPAGYYCPSPDQKIVCPVGHWCGEGFTEPKRCGIIMDCGAPGKVSHMEIRVGLSGRSLKMRHPLSLMTMRRPLSLMTCKYIPPRSITNPFRTAAAMFFSHYAPSVGVIDRPCCPVCPDERDTKAPHTQCSPPTHTPHTCYRALIAYSPHRTQGKPRTVWWAFLLLVTGVASIPVMVWLANR